ncbi:site-2 protease family protein [Streptomyces sp. NBC_01236]|uniref:site-2 protease family protein n=1 Tax=Streptomyces sp. NBC_01236 TaxID=2903789 RepID=UPI002E1665CA|nr:site-2 protease family protein [Streptomyces sp. NBC_01236]
MNGSFRIGRIFGVPLRMHWSVPLLVILIGYGLGHETLPAWLPGRSAAVYTFMSLAGSVLLMASLLLHEAAHAATARRNSVPVEDVTLWAMGGMTRMGKPGTAPVALAVAASGPVTSLLIGGVALASGAGLHSASGWAVPAALLVWLGWANMLLGVFNLLPAVPLDGGRVVHAALWWRTGERDRAELTADRGGQVIGMLLMAVGWLSLLRGATGGLWLAFIGAFIAVTAGAERQRAVLTTALRGVRVAEAMSSPVTTAPDWLTVDRFVDEVAVRARHSAIPLLDLDGRPTGIVQMRRIATVLAGSRATVRVRDVATPLSQLTLAAPDELLNDVLEKVHTQAGMRILVADGGRLVGIVTPHDLMRLLQQHTLTEAAQRGIGQLPE